jgi:hypothetical protein
MTPDALVVKNLLQIESEFRTMASGTTDILVSFLQFAFIQDVFSIFIDVMAVHAGQSCFGMAIMRKGHCRPCPFSQDL